MAQAKQNTSVYALLGILGILLLANVFVRWYRGSMSLTSQTDYTAAQQPPQLSKTPSPPQPKEKNPSPMQATVPAVLPPASAAGNPLDAIRALRDRLRQLPPLYRIPTFTFEISPSMKNPFRWGAEPPIVIATTTIVPINIPELIEPTPVFSGSFQAHGKKFVLIRIASDAFLLEEGEKVPETSYSLSVIGSASAKMRRLNGEARIVGSSMERSEGFSTALRALKGSSKPLRFKIRESLPGNARPFIGPVFEKTSDGKPLKDIPNRGVISRGKQ